MNEHIKELDKFKFIETGEGETLLLLHGLFGALSNFSHIIERFETKNTIIVPLLPILELPLREATLGNLVQYVKDFVEAKKLNNIHLLGNSLGGHIALLFALDCPEKVKSITLTGSSGLFENAMGSSFPKRKNYEFMKKKVEDTFYDPKTADKDLVDSVFDIVNDRNKAIRVITTAKSAIRHNLSGQLGQIVAPTLLIWGKQDKVTPPFVGEEFNKRIKNSKLVFIDKCGHAPMMEVPEEFNDALENFLGEFKETGRI